MDESKFAAFFTGLQKSAKALSIATTEARESARLLMEAVAALEEDLEEVLEKDQGARQLPSQER